MLKYSDFGKRLCVCISSSEVQLVISSPQSINVDPFHYQNRHIVNRYYL